MPRGVQGRTTFYTDGKLKVEIRSELSDEANHSIVARRSLRDTVAHECGHIGFHCHLRALNDGPRLLPEIRSRAIGASPHADERQPSGTGIGLVGVSGKPRNGGAPPPEGALHGTRTPAIQGTERSQVQSQRPLLGKDYGSNISLSSSRHLGPVAS